MDNEDRNVIVNEEQVYSMTGSEEISYSEIVTPGRNVIPTNNCMFKPEWQNFPEFQTWLRPISDDKSKAWCQACEKVFKADLKSLRVHGVGRSHVRMVHVKFPEAAAASPSPAAVYNVITDRKGTYGLGILSKNDNNSTAGSTLYVNPTNPSTNVLTCDPKQDKDNYVVVSMPKSEIEEHEQIQELHVRCEDNSKKSSIDLNDRKAPNSCKRRTKIQKPNEQFAEDLIETEDLEEEDEDEDEDDKDVEEDEDDDDDSVYEFESRMGKVKYSKREAFKRNALGLRSRSPQLLEVAQVTKPAPFWKAKAIVNGHVSELKLIDYLGRYLILFFYPQDFSKLCSKEILDLSDRIAEFRNMNTEVVACSVDSYLTHQVWSKMSRKDGGVSYPKIPLLSDYTHDISKRYGCYLPQSGHSLRAHYIIDTKGVLRYKAVSDVQITRDLNGLLKLIEAVQQVDDKENNMSDSEDV